MSMEFVSGNIFIRPGRLENVGDTLDGHEHNFDHTTLFLAGSFRVKKWIRAVKGDGSPVLDVAGDPAWLLVQDIEVVAPHHLLIEATAKHSLTATAPGSVFWCVYAHRSPQGEVIQYYNGWTKANT